MKGRPKQYLWRIIAFDLLKTLTQEDIYIRTQKLMEEEGLSLKYHSVLNSAIRECLKSVDLTITCNIEEKENEIFERKMQELNKEENETWGEWLVHNPKQIIDVFKIARTD